MTDLQCPARILLARHGEAGYDRPELLSDDGGCLTDLGREQAAALAQRLAPERVAAIYTSRLERARQTGAVVAEALGLTATAVDGLQEFSVGSLAGTPAMSQQPREVFVAWVTGDLGRRWPGGETGQEVVDRMVAAVEAIADRHRGEAVLVVSHGGAMSLAVPATARNLSARAMLDSMVPNCAVAELAVGGDGWELVGPWPGQGWEGPPVDEVQAAERAAQNNRAPTSSMPRNAS